jgi:hypothetical protein
MSNASVNVRKGNCILTYTLHPIIKIERIGKLAFSGDRGDRTAPLF